MLKRLELSGFKSIKQATIDLKPINVLIGANGAGKSNFVSLFKMLRFFIQGSLQEYVGKEGYANTLLHFGSKVTSEINIRLDLDIKKNDENYPCVYKLELIHVAGDMLMSNMDTISNVYDIQEPRVGIENVNPEQKQVVMKHLFEVEQKAIRSLFVNEVKNYHIYQFHDTSIRSQLRSKCDIGFNDYLAHDGGNLPALLYKLKKASPEYYQRIVNTIQQLAPFFNDFVLEPDKLNNNKIELRWHSKYDYDYIFHVHQLSDGLLRAIALVTLFLQPAEDLPSLIVVDEPELGLHPYALSTIIELAQAVTYYGSQVILATQSTILLDHFEPEDIIVVEQNNGESSFKHLNSNELQDWLEDYSLSELWEKNVLGGIPS